MTVPSPLSPAPVLVAAEIYAEHALAQIRVNDVPVTTIGQSGPTHAFEPLPAHVVRGGNLLAARVQPAPTAGPGAVPRLLVRVAVFSEGDEYFTEAGQELARLAWTGQAPQVVSQPFEAAFGPAQWSWARCRRWSDPQEALAAARPFVEDLARAIDQSDAAWIDRHSDAKFTDMAQAFAGTPEAQMREIAANIVASSPRFHERVRGVPMVPQLLASGHLLEVSRPDGLSYFAKPDSDGSAFEPQLLIGLIGRDWQVVR